MLSSVPPPDEKISKENKLDSKETSVISKQASLPPPPPAWPLENDSGVTFYVRKPDAREMRADNLGGAVVMQRENFESLIFEVASSGVC